MGEVRQGSSALLLSHCHRNTGIILISKLFFQLFNLTNSYLWQETCKGPLGLNNLTMWKSGGK